MNIFYSDHIVLPLPRGHRFPIAKYRRLRERVAALALPGAQLVKAPAASDEELLCAHDAAYLRRICNGELSRREVRDLGFPWSPQLVERSRRSVGATLAAAHSALRGRIGLNLAGGTHHAFAAHCGGYCVFNDIAVAALNLLSQRRIRNALIVDCDVHQGDGTAAILRDQPSLYTLSIHGARNYPHHKVASDLDIALADETSDAAYLEVLSNALNGYFAAATPDLVFYLAGADPFIGDKLGRLAVTKHGLMQRDQKIFEVCRTHATPLTIVMGGGYAENIDDIVDIHLRTVVGASRFALPAVRTDETQPGNTAGPSE